MTLGELRNHIESSLRNSGCEGGREVDFILELCTGLDRLTAFMERDSDVASDAVRKAEEIIERRAKGEPLQYIAGKTEFMGFEFEVSKDVLIPRPETEILVESAVKFLSSGEASASTMRVLDLCTGSGCIAISIALLCPRCKVVATDISPAALRVAARNASALGASIKFYEGDLFAAFGSPFDAIPLSQRQSGSLVYAGVHDARLPLLFRGLTPKFFAALAAHFHRPLFSLIVSNPPYIASGDMASLPREVRDYEPHSALDGGSGGLETLGRLIFTAPDHLLSGGLLLVEIGYDQGEAVRNLAQECGKFSEIFILKDYSGHDRILRAHRV